MLRLQPLYQERVWGGRALESALGRSLPGYGPIGESWEIVDRPEAQSVVRGGAHDGKPLRQVLASHAAEIMGPKWPVDRPFPILVKWLDCRERLSLQVHPPAAVAPALKGEPKTENWYIADTVPNARLIVGLKRGVTRDQFEKALHANTLESCVHSFPVSAGDSILVHSGQIHAIDAGNLILEIQQNSDTTYRVYDWGRVGLDGKPRAMHVRESLLSIKWDDFEPAPVRGDAKAAVIADAAEFRISRRPLARGEALAFAAGEQPRILSVVSGRLRASDEVFSRGDNIIIGYSESPTFTAEEGALVLVTDNFTN
ncbi:MAG: type I phosphomannose isomerase catalytic subunit [Opitutaceae bacterium]|nr:type I phosphomannose isomerase catalytic subunit [Opitutaceae bacterium]